MRGVAELSYAPAKKSDVNGEPTVKLPNSMMVGLIALGLSTAATAQTDDAAANSVRAADAAWLKVYSAKDLTKSVAFFDEQGSLLSPNDPIATGKAAVSKLVASDFAYWSGEAAARARVDSIATDAAAAAAMKPRRLIVSFIDSPSSCNGFRQSRWLSSRLIYRRRLGAYGQDGRCGTAKPDHRN